MTRWRREFERALRGVVAHVPAVRHPASASQTMSRPPRLARPQYAPASPSGSTFSQAPQYVSSRATYPTFLSLQETARLQLTCAGRGLVDAFRWDTVIRLIARCVATTLACYQDLIYSL